MTLRLYLHCHPPFLRLSMFWEGWIAIQSMGAMGGSLRLWVGVRVGKISLTPAPTQTKRSTPTDSNSGLDSDSEALFMAV